MIQPSVRLLWLWGLLGTPLLAVVLFGFVSLSPILVGLLVTVAVDAYRGRAFRTKFRASTNAEVDMVRGRESTLRFLISNRASRTTRAEIALSLPPSFGVSKAVMPPTDVAAQSECQWSLSVRPPARGKWTVQQYSYRLRSPWGLWQVLGSNPLPLTINVYPDLSANQTAVSLLHHRTDGFKAFRLIGTGRDFEKLREYSAGDTFDQIYWKGSAKRGRLMTKVFQVERSQPCYVLLDCSRATAKALDTLVEAALVLGLAAERFGDQFGVVTYSDRIHSFERAHGGVKHFVRCRNAIYALQTQPVSADIPEVVRFVQQNVRKRALLFLLSSFDDPYANETLALHIKPLAIRHATVVGALRPERVQAIFDGPQPETTSDVYRALAGHLAWTRLQNTGREIEHLGVRLALSDTSTVYRDLVNVYQSMRQGQLV